MSKMNPLELAINKYKKGVNKRNLNLWCDQVVSDINDQIQVRQDKVKVLVKELSQRKDEANEGLVDQLLNVDETRMTSVDFRKAYSKEYMLEAIQAISNFERKVEELESSITEEKEKVVTLQSLVSKFESIKVEESTEE